MRYGATLMYDWLSNPDCLIGAAQLMEELGFESLWLADHVVVPTAYSSVYPYNAQGRLSTEQFPEPLVSLAVLACATSHIELGTGVLVLPQRNPILLAKQVATLDVLARGRMRLGVGVGWLREEFEALGATFDDRGLRSDEYIDAMRELWTNAAPTFSGRYVQLEGSFELLPRPARRGGVAVVIGGHSPAAARRAARRGDGFFPFSFDAEVLAGLYDLVRSEAKALSRSADEIELIGPTAATTGWIQRIEDMGVTHAILPSGRSTTSFEEFKDKIRRFSDRTIDKRR
ncbi:MAG TPA: LLM class F420-dependent oxidoreductase [Jatrophihabitantaceae bacterium]|nr:LLM class F420-dependent oxidoreductase [Jatrophihabitantaceae bacterium]